MFFENGIESDIESIRFVEIDNALKDEVLRTLELHISGHSDLALYDGCTFWFLRCLLVLTVSPFRRTHSQTKASLWLEIQRLIL